MSEMMPLTDTNDVGAPKGSSGRRPALTGARLEKKRETDRQSQRAVRERTRNYIVHLEHLVESLGQGQRDEQLKTLVQQCKQLRDDNERLTSVIASIGRLTAGVTTSNTGSNDVASELEDQKAIAENSSQSTSPPTGQTLGSIPRATSIQGLGTSDITIGGYPAIYPDVGGLPWPTQSNTSMDSIEQLVASEPAGHASGTGPAMANPYASIQMSSTPILLNPEVQALGVMISDQTTGNIGEGYQPFLKQEKSMFVVVNELLTRARSFSLSWADDDDIVIRVVRDGWQACEERHNLDMGWQVLKQIDQIAFASCGPVERIATLRVLRMRLRHFAKSNNGSVPDPLPSFMRVRPTQTLIKHASLLDYIVWPDMRDWLILSAHDDAPDQIARLFASSVRFRWSSNFSDIWMSNPQNNISYSFSPQFLSRFDDLLNWSLASDFFQVYPELIGFVPIYNPGPERSLSGIRQHRNQQEQQQAQIQSHHQQSQNMAAELRHSESGSAEPMHNGAKKYSSTTPEWWGVQGLE